MIYQGVDQDQGCAIEHRSFLMKCIEQLLYSVRPYFAACSVQYGGVQTLYLELRLATGTWPHEALLPFIASFEKNKTPSSRIGPLVSFSTPLIHPKDPLCDTNRSPID